MDTLTERISPALAAGAAPQRAHARRPLTLAQVIAAAIRSAHAFARRMHEHQERRRRARAIRDELQQLDDRVLHDLGFHRGEIESVAAEATGSVESTRALTLWK